MQHTYCRKVPLQRSVHQGVWRPRKRCFGQQFWEYPWKEEQIRYQLCCRKQWSSISMNWWFHGPPSSTTHRSCWALPSHAQRQGNVRSGNAGRERWLGSQALGQWERGKWENSTFPWGIPLNVPSSHLHWMSQAEPERGHQQEWPGTWGAWAEEKLETCWCCRRKEHVGSPWCLLHLHQSAPWSRSHRDPGPGCWWAFMSPTGTNPCAYTASPPH